MLLLPLPPFLLLELGRLCRKPTPLLLEKLLLALKAVALILNLSNTLLTSYETPVSIDEVLEEITLRTDCS